MHEEPLELAAGDSSVRLQTSGWRCPAGRNQIASRRLLDAAGRRGCILGDGSVATWGAADRGGDSSSVEDNLKNVQQIQAFRMGAVDAILGDGSVVTWDIADRGGDSSSVRDQPKDVQ